MTGQHSAQSSGVIVHALALVEQRIESLPPGVHTEDPRTILSRCAANAFWTRRPRHDRALTLAALAVVLLVSIDRAETVDVASGEAVA